MSTTTANHYRLIILLLLAFMLTFDKTTATSQTTITAHHYKATYFDDNNCYNYAYDLTMPFVWETWDGDVRQKINAEIVRIGQDLRMLNMNDDHCGPDFYPTPDTCYTPQYPESTVIEYTVHTNTPEIFSMTLSEEWNASSDGHGSMSTVHCFNVNLKTNSSITLDSLYTPAEKEKVLARMMDTYYKTNPEFDRDEGADKYVGFCMEKGELVFFVERKSGVRRWVMRVG